MKKIWVSVAALVLVAVLSISSVGAYVLPQGIEVSRKEGASADSLSATEVYGFVGDADLNSKVNVRDATDIQKHSAGLITLTEEGMRLADVDFSGAVNVKDATAIQKWVANFSTEAPVYHTLYATDDETRTGMFVGFWKAEVNLADELNAVLMANDKNGLEFTEVYTSLNLIFNNDGTYSIYIADDDINDTLSNFKEGYKEALRSYLEKFIKDKNLSITVDDVVKSSGYDSLDDMVEQIVDEKAVLDILGKYSKEGRYRINGTFIEVSSSMEEDSPFDENAIYTFFDVNLIISGGSGLVDGRLQPAEFVFVQ